MNEKTEPTPLENAIALCNFTGNSVDYTPFGIVADMYEDAGNEMMARAWRYCYNHKQRPGLIHGRWVWFEEYQGASFLSFLPKRLYDTIVRQTMLASEIPPSEIPPREGQPQLLTAYKTLDEAMKYLSLAIAFLEK